MAGTEEIPELSLLQKGSVPCTSGIISFHVFGGSQKSPVREIHNTLVYLVSLLWQAGCFSNIQPQSFCNKLCWMSDGTLKKQVFSSTETTEVSVARHPLSCGYHAESQRHSKISQKRGLQKFCMILRPQQDRNCFALHRSLWIFQSHASYRKVAVSEGKTENENHYCLKLQNLKVIFLIPFSDPHPDSNNLFPSKL